MKTFKYILFLLLIVIIGASIYIAVQPNDFKVTRSRIIAAPSEVIYNQINDFKNLESWSTLVDNDPKTKIIIADSASGVDGAFSWENSHGRGTVKTVESTPYHSIDRALQYDEFAPVQVHWEFKKITASETEVSWTMSSDNLSFYEKGYALLHGGHHKMIGPDFDRGLEKLDHAVMAAMDVYAIKVDGITQHGGGFYIYSTTSSKISDIQTTISKLLPRVNSYATNNSIAMAGAPFIIYHKWDEANNAVMFSCAIPTTTEIITTQSDILTGQLEPFKAVKTTLKGNYTNLKEAWDASYNYIGQYNLEAAETGPMLETYLTQPSQQPNPANWITEIYIAIK